MLEGVEGEKLGWVTVRREYCRARVSETKQVNRRSHRRLPAEFEIWNGWIVAAFVLWALTAAIGTRTGTYYTQTQKLADEGKETEVIARLRAPTGATLHLATVALFVLLLLDMLFKPGA